MATPAYVRHASAPVGAAFSRYASAQINHGTGNNRVLLAWVTSDQSDPNNNFAACHAGCTSAGSIAGGVAMTPVAAAPNDESGRQQGRLFWLAGASLPAGISWVVGDATYADRKPGILAILFEDSGGGPITVSAFANISVLSTGLANSVTASGSTGNAERAVFVGAIYTTPTPTSPTVASSADTAGLASVFERNGAASSTQMAWTHTSNGFAGGTMVVLAGATAPGDTTPPVITGPAGATGATSAISLAENTTAVHTFTANESVTWSINGGADAARFTIGSGTGALVFATAPNFESPTDADTNNTYIVGVRATDTAGNATTQTCTVTVVNANEAPTFAGPSIANLTGTVGDAINVTDLATRFTDPDSGDTGTYTTGGSWPTGPVLTSAGVLQGIFPAAGTYGSLTVIRTDASALTATSNAFSITASTPSTPTATLNGALDSITGNLAATAVQGRLTSALPLRDAARVVLANRSDVAVHVQGIADLASIALLSSQSIAAGIWTAVGPFVPGVTYAVTYGVGGTRIGCEIIVATTS
jgi:hypothetical protein